MKPKKIYSEKYKGTIQNKIRVYQNIKAARYVEVMEAGKMSDGSEFIIYKVVIK